MSANILEAVQGFATPAMIAAATSTLGLNDKQASAALGAAVTAVLGGTLQKSSDAGVMTNIASLAAAVTPDVGMFSNIAGMLAGGIPTSPLQVLGNRLLGVIFGSNQAAMIAAVASATGISGKAASGLVTLAAPMALAAMRSKLGAAPTAAGLVNLLATDRGLIAQAMPAPLRTLFSLTSAVPAAAAATPPPSVAAVAPAATPSVSQTIAPAAAAAPEAGRTITAAPVAHTSSGHASAPAAAAPKAPAPSPAPVATAAAAPADTPRPLEAASSVATERPSLGILPFIGMMVPLAAMAIGIWYWAYGSAGGRSAVDAAKTIAQPVVEAARPAAEKKAEAAAPLAGTPSATGLKYTLPGGGVIDVHKAGVEQKLIEFITGPAAVDKNVWFDFDRLSFETASSDLTPTSKAQVEAIMAILKAYPAVKVKIGGYTDNQGDPQANLKLSDQRAKRVAAELVKLGLDAGRVEAEGYGDQHAVGDNATAEGRARNRRTALSVRAK